MASYRLQLNSQFGFREAEKQLDYLKLLGISALYLSPILQATPCSTHGYDMTDPQKINSELGGEPAFASFMQKAKSLSLGVILDFVPNHQSIHHSNPYWWDVMKNGPDSEFADQFDIRWENLDGSEVRKLVLPVLGASLSEVLEKQEIQLNVDSTEPHLQYYEHRFPLSPKSVPFAKGGDSVQHLLLMQNYQLSFWQEGLKQLNYRRFFNIAELAGVRVEDPKVYARVHEKLFEILQRYPVTGLRLDHIDGLKSPTEYLLRLHDDLQSRGVSVGILVEKILGVGEVLPSEWPVQGTTGYESMNFINESFVDVEGYHKIAGYYESQKNWRDPAQARSPRQLLFEVKLEVINKLFDPEFDRLECKLKQLDGMDTANLIAALKDLTAAMAVYRCYPQTFPDAENMRPVWHAFDSLNFFLGNQLTDHHLWWHDLFKGKLPLDGKWVLDFLQTWQQVCGAVMAKGYEDCFLYRFHPLLSRNEVGSHIDMPPSTDPLHDFEAFSRQQTRYPQSMNATATHDMKRGEDVRARLNVLSEVPGEWNRLLENEMAWVRSQGVDFDANTLVFIYQSLIGSLPSESEKDFAERWKAYLVKAQREAQQFTSWLQVNDEFESRLQMFADRILAERKGLLAFAKKISFYGALNSLSQLALKTFMPGTPDFYQGTELWDFSFVDPDNRRPVDYSKRFDALRKSPINSSMLLNHWQDGQVKLWLTHEFLECRNQFPWLAHADLEVLQAKGKAARNLICFHRESNQGELIVLVGRFFVSLLVGPDSYEPSWQDTAIDLPEGRWAHSFSDKEFQGKTMIENLLSHLPVAILTKV